jgi:hypothetical protein
MTRFAVAAVVCLALIIAAALLTRRPHDRSDAALSEPLPREVDQSLAIAVQGQELSGTGFVVPSSYSSLRAAGRCQRGQVQATVTPNRPFRSLTATVIDVPVDGRIRRHYEFLVDAIDGEIINGHFSDGDPCSLRLVPPGSVVDPVAPPTQGTSKRPHEVADAICCDRDATSAARPRAG